MNTNAVVGATAAFVVVMVALVVLMRSRRAQRRSTDLAELARSMGLQFSRNVARADFADFAALAIIKKFRGGANRISGRLAGVPVELLDYTYAFALRGTTGAVDESVTIALLVTDHGVPRFDLRPRLALLDRIGSEDQIKIEAGFDSEYVLTPRSELFVVNDRSKPPQSPDAVRERFTSNLVRFFVEHPGLHVESGGGSLAVWRGEFRHRRQIVPVPECGELLQNALTIRQHLLKH
ncbi:MAG TPA: hypothetical protein VII32_12715 [Thermoanaerobaculia bacterium]